MSITNPTQLVDEFKKSGEFDRLRRELLSQFQQSDGLAAFKSRIEDIARQRIISDQKMRFLPEESVHRELIQEMDRYPVVERAAADVQMLSDPSFTENIRNLIHGIIRDGKGQHSRPQKENDIDVKPGTPDVIISPPSATEAAPFPQPPTVVSGNTPPPITTVPEKSPLHAPEGGLEKEKTIIAAIAPCPDPPIVTLTTADGSSAVDVDMKDGRIAP
ncbi:hypothetical protein BDZ94DRAFT_1244660 [Collybia nuda]|uniref:BOD1/SHG1 domain-containing protein n=1 Tax=Collybia nuda TaxID=64659 RepID=A0A9P5YH16_9AGAR|nr:hypothetical protein BDZ94DRAFT_1244660 [Collybia nuda]